MLNMNYRDSTLFCITWKKYNLIFRTRERTNVQRLSAVCAALRYQSEDDDTASSQMEFEGDSDLEDGDSPFWVLFSAIKNYKTPEGELLSQPFLKLPSKK